jgi:hypothetical protein
MAKHLGRARPIRLFTAWNKDQAAAADFIGNPWWGMGHLGQGSQIMEMGRPAASHSQAAAVTLLFPQSMAVMSPEEIRKALGGGVYTDVETLNVLNQLGFQDLTGMSAEQPQPRGLHRGIHRPSAQRPVRQASTGLPSIVLSSVRLHRLGLPESLS